MKTRHAHEIRKGILVARADIKAAMSTPDEGLSITTRVQLTEGVLRTKLMRYAHAEYTRRRVVLLSEG